MNEDKIHLILPTPPPSEWRTSQPYGDAGCVSPTPMLQMFPTTMWLPQVLCCLLFYCGL